MKVRLTNWLLIDGWLGALHSMILGVALVELTGGISSPPALRYLLCIRIQISPSVGRRKENKRR